MPDTAPSALATRASHPEPATGPLTVILNAAAGASDKANARDELEALLQRAGRRYRIVAPARHQSFDQLCAQAAADAHRERGVLVAAGGDGTVNGAANAARRHGVPLGVIPLGTFNYFVRDRSLAADPEAAVQALADGSLRTVHAGEVNGRLVLNNASIGLYTHLIRRRERATARFGRRRIVAAVSAAAALIRGQRAFAIRLADGDEVLPTRTSMLFASCNAMQLEALGLSTAGCSGAGALGIVLLRPTQLGDRLRLLWNALTRELDDDPALESFCAKSLEVRSQRPSVEVVIDGELASLRTPLTLRWLPDALTVVAPRA